MNKLDYILNIVDSMNSLDLTKTHIKEHVDESELILDMTHLTTQTEPWQ